MKKGISKLGMMAIALAGLATVSPTQTTRVERGVTVTNAGKEQVKKTVRSARQYVRASAGGFNVMSHNPGTPPHIYGRRGTHKKTNC